MLVIPWLASMGRPRIAQGGPLWRKGDGIRAAIPVRAWRTGLTRVTAVDWVILLRKGGYDWKIAALRTRDTHDI